MPYSETGSTAEMPHSMIVSVALYDSSKAAPRKVIHHLGKHQFADVSGAHPVLEKKQQDYALRRSNRNQLKTASWLQQINMLQASHATRTGQALSRW